MSEVPIQISGVLYDKTARTQRPVVILGNASIFGLGVGGGPIVPPDAPEEPPRGDHIWGGGNEPFPTPPIVIPRPPVDFPNPPSDGLAKPPPPNGGWGYSPEYGWGYFPGPNQAQPK